MLPLSILFLLVSFASVGAVLFTPALPAIQDFFGISTGKVQLTITSYLIGYALGQLPYGPLANAIGRKKTLYLGILLSIVGSLLCAFSLPLQSFPLLVGARFIQALGACAGLKVSFTMIADVYDQKDATKMVSKLIVAFAIMPGISIAIGGFLTEILGWNSCFYFLALFGVFMLFLVSRLSETAKSIHPKALKFLPILEGYKLQLSNRRLVLSGLIMGLGTAVIYVFASKAPFIGIEQLNMSPKFFGLWNLIPPLGMLAGSYLALKLGERFQTFKLIKIGILSSLIACFSMLLPFSFGAIHVVSLFVPMVFIYAAESIVFANISSFGLAHATDKSNASALLNFLNMGMGCIAVFLSEALMPEAAIFMPAVFTSIFILMFFCYLRVK